MRTRMLFVVVALALTAVPVSAQTVINPRFAEFTVSPDHSAVKLDGTSVVTRYEMVATAQTALGALVWTQDLGKPTPTAAGLATVSLPAVLPITVEALYTARVTAIGPDGTSPPSAPSNPFGVAGAKVPAAAGAPRFRT